MVLHQRGLHPECSEDQAIAAVGGDWVALGSTEPSVVLADVKARDIRALTVHRSEISFLQDLPDLEFLTVNDPRDVAPIHSLHRLRGLTFNGAWNGQLDFSKLPHLEWLFIAEADPKTGLETLFAGHARLRHLAIGRYPKPDLRPLANLPALERLEIFNSRRLVSLAGAESVSPRLRQLVLAICPKLESLDGIQALRNLEYFRIEACNRITAIAPVASLPRLVYLDLAQDKGVDSLKPLAAHPTLEFVSFGRVFDGDLDPLTTIPNLKLINTPGRRFNRSPSEFPQFGDFDHDHPLRVRYRRMAVG